VMSMSKRAWCKGGRCTAHLPSPRPSPVDCSADSAHGITNLK
jgi:hypothetical protein